MMSVFALIVLLPAIWRGKSFPQLARIRTPAIILLMLAALALSLTYTPAPFGLALHELSKYGKLLVIPMVLLLVRTRREALLALGIYAAAQTFVVLTSYLLTLDLALPWVPKPRELRLSIGTVYSSYLDQAIMTAGLATLCWHLRHEFPGRHRVALAVGLMLLCAVNVLFFLPGRSGQAALLAALALALFWGVPRHGKWVALVAPPLLLAAAIAISPGFRDRLFVVVTESQAYSHGDRSPESSAGTRLTFWRRSFEAIRERPLLGHGVGSWGDEFRRLEGSALNPTFRGLRNPHQEYLMWGVQLGAVGVALLLAFLLQVVRDAARFRPDVRHATQSLTAILAIVCLFNTILFDALIGDYFCLLIGVLLALGLHTAPTPEPAS